MIQMWTKVWPYLKDKNTKEKYPFTVLSLQTSFISLDDLFTSVTTVRQAHTSSSVMISWETKKNVDLRFWIKPLMYKCVLSLQFMGSKYLFRVSKEWIQILWCAKCACTLVTEVQRCCNTKQSSTTRFRNANDSMCNLKQSDVALIGH